MRKSLHYFWETELGKMRLAVQQKGIFYFRLGGIFLQSLSLLWNTAAMEILCKQKSQGDGNSYSSQAAIRKKLQKPNGSKMQKSSMYQGKPQYFKKCKSFLQDLGFICAPTKFFQTISLPVFDLCERMAIYLDIIFNMCQTKAKCKCRYLFNSKLLHTVMKDHIFTTLVSVSLTPVFGNLQNS